MDFLPKRALDRPYNSICAMGLVFLYLDLDDVQLHRGLIQGKSFVPKREKNLSDARSSVLPHSPALVLSAT